MTASTPGRAMRRPVPVWSVNPKCHLAPLSDVGTCFTAYLQALSQLTATFRKLNVRGIKLRHFPVPGKPGSAPTCRSCPCAASPGPPTRQRRRAPDPDVPPPPRTREHAGVAVASVLRQGRAARPPSWCAGTSMTSPALILNTATASARRCACSCSEPAGRLFHQRRVLLRHLVHLRHRAVHLVDAAGLLFRRRRDLAHDVRHALDRRHDLLHRRAARSTCCEPRRPC